MTKPVALLFLTIPLACARPAGATEFAPYGTAKVDVPAGFAELVHWQGKGYQYVNPNSLPVRGVRYLDRPQAKKD